MVLEPAVQPRACSIAAALGVLGEKWSLLVVRELSLGVTTFDKIQRNTGAPRDILASRLRRLEESGTLSYRAEVDPRALGYTLFAIVRISPSGGGLRLIPGIAREVPAITECFRITGEDCFFIKVYLHSIDELEPILDLFTPHGRTTTSIVHSAPVPPRPLPVPVP